MAEEIRKQRKQAPALRVNFHSNICTLPKRERNRILNYLAIICLLTLSSIVIYNNLGSSTINDWDEARHGQNALELTRTKDPIVLKYAGQTELRRPPLGAWLISLSFILFGFNEFALRFVSATCGVATILVTYMFGKKLYNIQVGVIAACLLLANSIFIGFHGARTGDYDTLLTLFITLALYFFYVYTIKPQRRLLVLSGISLAFATLTKFVMVLYPIAIMLVYLVYTKSLRRILNRDVLYSLLAYAIIALPWFILRFLKGDRYFDTVIDYLFIRRITEPMEGHAGDWTFYPLVILNALGPFIFILFAVSFLYAIFLALRGNKIMAFLSTWTLVFITLFTLAGTKIFWYITPMYPAISIMMAAFIDDLKKYLNVKTTTYGLAVFLLLFPNLVYVADSVWTPYKDPTHESINAMKNDLGRTEQLYIPQREFTQSTYLYLSFYTNSTVRTYMNISEISDEKHHVFTSDINDSKRLDGQEDYELVKRYLNVSALYVKKNK